MAALSTQIVTGGGAHTLAAAAGGGDTIEVGRTPGGWHLEPTMLLADVAGTATTFTVDGVASGPYTSLHPGQTALPRWVCPNSIMQTVLRLVRRGKFLESEGEVPNRLGEVDCDFEHSFQAPEMYRARGYLECGRIDDYPRGFAHIHLVKDLLGEGSAKVTLALVRPRAEVSQLGSIQRIRAKGLFVDLLAAAELG